MDANQPTTACDKDENSNGLLFSKERFLQMISPQQRSRREIRTSGARTADTTRRHKFTRSRTKTSPLPATTQNDTKQTLRLPPSDSLFLTAAREGKEVWRAYKHRRGSGHIFRVVRMDRPSSTDSLMLRSLVDRYHDLVSSQKIRRSERSFENETKDCLSEDDSGETGESKFSQRHKNEPKCSCSAQGNSKLSELSTAVANEVCTKSSRMKDSHMDSMANMMPLSQLDSSSKNVYNGRKTRGELLKMRRNELQQATHISKAVISNKTTSPTPVKVMGSINDDSDSDSNASNKYAKRDVSFGHECFDEETISRRRKSLTEDRSTKEAEHGANAESRSLSKLSRCSNVSIRLIDHLNKAVMLPSDTNNEIMNQKEKVKVFSTEAWPLSNNTCEQIPNLKDAFEAKHSDYAKKVLQEQNTDVIGKGDSRWSFQPITPESSSGDTSRTSAIGIASLTEIDYSPTLPSLSADSPQSIDYTELSFSDIQQIQRSKLRPTSPTVGQEEEILNDIFKITKKTESDILPGRKQFSPSRKKLKSALTSNYTSSVIESASMRKKSPSVMHKDAACQYSPPFSEQTRRTLQEIIPLDNSAKSGSLELSLNAKSKPDKQSNKQKAKKTYVPFIFYSDSESDLNSGTVVDSINKQKVKLMDRESDDSMDLSRYSGVNSPSVVPKCFQAPRNTNTCCCHNSDSKYRTKPRSCEEKIYHDSHQGTCGKQQLSKEKQGDPCLTSRQKENVSLSGSYKNLNYSNMSDSESVAGMTTMSPSRPPRSVFSEMDSILTSQRTPMTLRELQTMVAESKQNSHFTLSQNINTNYEQFDLQKELVSNCENSSTFIGEYLLKLWRSQCLCDVQVQVGQDCFMAHKLVLAAFSDVFCPTTPQPPPSVCFNIPDSSPEAVYQIFRYLYTSSMELRDELLEATLSAALFMGITEVVDVVKDILEKPTVENVTLYLNIKNKFGMRSSFMDYPELMHKNFKELAKSPEFLEVSVDDIERVLQDPDVLVDSELDTVRVLASWVEYNLFTRCTHLPRLLALINFECISPATIATLQEDYPHIFCTPEGQKVITEAFKFHALKNIPGTEDLLYKEDQLTSDHTRTSFSNTRKSFLKEKAQESKQASSAKFTPGSFMLQVANSEGSQILGEDTDRESHRIRFSQKKESKESNLKSTVGHDASHEDKSTNYTGGSAGLRSKQGSRGNREDNGKSTRSQSSGKVPRTKPNSKSGLRTRQRHPTAVPNERYPSRASRRSARRPLRRDSSPDALCRSSKSYRSPFRHTGRYMNNNNNVSRVKGDSAKRENEKYGCPENLSSRLLKNAGTGVGPEKSSLCDCITGNIGMESLNVEEYKNKTLVREEIRIPCNSGLPRSLDPANKHSEGRGGNSLSCFRSSPTSTNYKVRCASNLIALQRHEETLKFKETNCMKISTQKLNSASSLGHNDRISAFKTYVAPRESKSSVTVENQKCAPNMSMNGCSILDLFPPIEHESGNNNNSHGVESEDVDHTSSIQYFQEVREVSLSSRSSHHEIQFPLNIHVSKGRAKDYDTSSELLEINSYLNLEPSNNCPESSKGMKKVSKANVDNHHSM
ncbi:uncharacterized protein LOC101848445 [Aplysia californica]|uniref:Uncharacterized protein LOC101848445 n=1 Tax=Aplysia californica TaxID=6500 RepID=A0ABM1A4D0_APLCA|nr:uncharacterized protein LOC101848445 [Aplysia californica]